MNLNFFQFNDSIEFIDKSLESHLSNESIDAHLNKTLFTEAKDLLLKFVCTNNSLISNSKFYFQCRNLTSTPVESVDKFPPLSCSISTCSSDILNYLVLFIISIITSSLVLIICIVHSFQTRRKSITTQQSGRLINSLSTTNTSVNT